MTGRMAGLVEPTNEPWVTKQQLADHLLVTRRWVELQQQAGLPYLRMGGMNRYASPRSRHGYASATTSRRSD